MRALLVLLVALSATACLAAPDVALCPSLPAQLELRPSPFSAGRFSLVFTAIDPEHKPWAPDFVDIHYRINNEAATNLRVLTQGAITDTALRAKQAQVDDIDLQSGDALRAYATYSSKGIACDTPMHTFAAPESQSTFTTNSVGVEQIGQDTLVQPGVYQRNVIIHATGGLFGISETKSFTVPGSIERGWTEDHKGNCAIQVWPREKQNVVDYSVGCPVFGSGDVVVHVQYRKISGTTFATQSALPLRRPVSFIYTDASATGGSTCPTIPIEQDVLKIAGQRDSYMLVFENKNPQRQLKWVDLHVTTKPELGWDNLRLGTDLQLHMAHKVLQPGIVVHNDEALHFYWTYRTVDNDGKVVDCTTPVTSMTPMQVTHSVDLNSIGNFRSL